MGAQLTMISAFAGMPHGARVIIQAEVNQQPEQRYDLFLWKVLPDTILEKAGLDQNGGVSIQWKSTRGHVVEIWMARAMWSPDGERDVAMILEIVKEGERENLQRICWIEEDYEPPTPYWFKDYADRPILLPSNRSGPKVAQIDITLDDKSLFQSRKPLTLHMIIQR